MTEKDLITVPRAHCYPGSPWMEKYARTGVYHAHRSVSTFFCEKETSDQGLTGCTICDILESLLSRSRSKKMDDGAWCSGRLAP